MTNNSTLKPSPNPPTRTLDLHLQQPKSKRHINININQATIEEKTHGILQYRSSLLQRKGNASGVESADLSNHQQSRKSNTQQHVRQQRGGGGQEQEGTTSKAKETRHRHGATKTRKTTGYTSSKLKVISPGNAIVIAKHNDLDTVVEAREEKRELPVALQIELNALIQESPKSEQPVNPIARPISVGKSKEGNSVDYILIHELIEEAFFLCEDCRDVLCQGELDEDEESELSVRVEREMTGSIEFNRMRIHDPVTVTENFREKTKEVLEFAKALEEEAQIQMEETQVKVEVEQRQVDELLLPKALWMC